MKLINKTMTKSCILIIFLVGGISLFSQSTISEFKGIDLTNNLDAFKIKYPDFNTLYSDEDRSSYAFGKILINNTYFDITGDFDNKGNLLVIRMKGIGKEINTIYDETTEFFKNKLPETTNIIYSDVDYQEKGMRFEIEDTQCFVVILKAYDDKPRQISIGIGIDVDYQAKIRHKEKLSELENKYGKEFAPFILGGYIVTGMSEDMVIKALGNPDSRNKTILVNSVSVQLVYYNPTSRFYNQIKSLYIYLENGIVTAIQEKS